MFSDPQSVTVNAVAQSMPRIGSGDNRGVFQKDDATYKLDLSHTYDRGRARRLVRFTNSKVATDPLLSGVNTRVSANVYMVIDHPTNGTYTNAELKLIVDGFLAYLTASSGANVTKIIGGES